MSVKRTLKNTWRTFEFILLGLSTLAAGVVGTFLFLDWLIKFHHPQELPEAATPEQIALFTQNFHQWLGAYDKAELILAGIFLYVVLVVGGLLVREIYRKGHTLHVNEHTHKQMLDEHVLTKRELEEWKRKHAEASTDLLAHQEKVALLQAKVEDLLEKLPGRVVEDLMTRAAAMRRQLPPPEPQKEKDISPNVVADVTATEVKEEAATDGEVVEKVHPEEVLEVIGHEPPPKPVQKTEPSPKKKGKGLLGWFKKAESKLGMGSTK